MNAFGNTVPPIFVFIQGGPPQAIGADNSSGWITATEFYMYLDHFIIHTKPNPTDPVLLLLDNHQSHIDINVVQKAMENSIMMLSFPPICTHSLQPLDVGVNGHLKTTALKLKII